MANHNSDTPSLIVGTGLTLLSVIFNWIEGVDAIAGLLVKCGQFSAAALGSYLFWLQIKKHKEQE